MNPMVTVQHIRHFSQFGWIEFEHFLSLEECEKIKTLLQETVIKRLGRGLSRCSPEEIYKESRDCWRDQPWLKKLVQNQRFRAISEQLSGKTHLILACDQWIPSGVSFDPLHLSAHFSFQNLACGCLIGLEGNSIGQVRFIHPERFPLFGTSEFLVVYGTLQTVYICNPKDPSNSFLKQFGYDFGDRLAK